MENRRGILITNTISKLFENVKLNENQQRICNGLANFKLEEYQENQQLTTY